MSAGGGESITQCSSHNNQWCCNADATSVDCCQEEPEPRPFFNLQDGVAYATVGSKEASSNPTISTVTGDATYGPSASSPARSSTAASSSDVSSSATSTPPTSAPTTPVTSIGTSVRSVSGGSGRETIYITNIVTPAAVATADAAGTGSSSSGSSGSNMGLIIGCAVGIPLGLALVGILLWMLRKRRQQKDHPYKTTPDGGDSPDMAPAALASPKKQEIYRHSRPGTTEIDSNPVGPGRPTSTIAGKAELDSGAGFQPGSGTPYTPDTAFIGGGSSNRSTWGSPPGYSPGQNQEPFAHNQERPVELDSSMVMPVINERSEAQPEYQAYRPPNPVAEMPTIKTPPEDIEKQLEKQG